MSERMDKLLSLLSRIDPGRKLNEEQLAAVFSDKNTVVSAGAGSGKTSVLSVRFLRLLLEGKAKSDEILTLTFTRKAAMEMGERIRKLVSLAGPEVGQEDLERLSKAEISTLDSFASQIVRMDCVRYGISRDFQLEDEMTRNAKVRRLAHEFLADPANEAECAVLTRCYSPSQILDSFFALVDERVTLTGDYDAKRTAHWLDSRLVADHAKLRGQMVRTLGELIPIASPKNRESAIVHLSHICEDGDGDLEDASKEYKFTASGKNEEMKELVREYKEMLAKYLVLNRHLSSDLPYDKLLTAIEKFANILKREKRRSSVLSFGDVANLALEILRENAEVRTWFKNRFKAIMIDEFQDNNSLQRDMMFLLAEKKELCCTGRVPTVDELEDGMLFFVGDEKQSIYRFRGADVSVFRALQDEISSSGGTLIQLSHNYRSAPGLVAHFNSVFANVMGTVTEDYEARYEESIAGRPDSPCSITLMLADKDTLKSSDEDAMRPDECEAEEVASLIDEMLSTDGFLIDGRRPTPADIAVLFPRRSHQVEFETALKRHGTPYQVAVPKSLMQEALASDYYHLIEAALHPEEEFFLLSTLRSPFARISDKGLKAIAQDGLDATLDEADGAKLSAFLTFFNDLKDSVSSYSIPALLDHIYYEGGYHAFLQSDKSYRGYQEHHDYLFSYAVAYQEAGLGVTDFLSFMRERLGSRERLDDTSVLHERKDGVQLMTVHASKGLEFPIVIVASCGGASNKAIESRYVYMHRGRLVASLDKDLRSYLEDEGKKMDEAEQKRLLYVALTRAERHLVVSGLVNLTQALDITCNPFFKIYLEAIGVSFNPPAFPKGVTTRMISLHERTFDGRRDDSYLTSLEKAGVGHQAPIFESRKQAVKPSDIEELDDDGIEELPAFASDAICKSKEESAVFGTAVHAYIEHSLKNEDIEPAFADPLFSGPDGRTLRSDAIKMADNFLSSSFWKSLASFKRMNEWRFMAYDEAGDSVVEGVVDLIVDLGPRLIVIDFKSDRTKAEWRHKGQVLTYLKAVQAAFKKPAAGCLFFLREDAPSTLWDAEGGEVDPSVLS